MANVFKMLVFLIILTSKEANGRPPTKGLKYGKFIHGQPSVSKGDILLKNRRINFSLLFAELNWTYLTDKYCM